MLLIKCAVHGSVRSYSPLTFAALLGQCRILRFMMMAQVDLNSKDQIGRTALYVGTAATSLATT
jgi:hypothetical protein